MRIYIKFVIDKYLEIAEYKALCNGFRYYYLLGNLRQYADTSSHLPYTKTGFEKVQLQIIISSSH